MCVNLTFKGSEPTRFNACVGNNGKPSYYEYSEGFSQAANVLINLVLTDSTIYLLDQFVYPVCFNMRHSVELRLKGAIENICHLAKIKGKTLLIDLSRTHDIKKLWEFFVDESESLDSRYKNINLKLAPTILDIASVDPTGQTFRYPFSNEAQRHLTNVSLINFIVLKKKFNEIEEHLNNLREMNDYLLDEYSVKSFTTKLSRMELFYLAEDLPLRDEWRDEGFKEIKNNLKKSYGLSSNDLTKAIRIIEANYEMSYLIGKTLELKGVTKDNLMLFLDKWQCMKNIYESQNYQDSSKQERKVIDYLVETITSENLAGIYALFYFSRNNLMFSEVYLIIYEEELVRIKNEFKKGTNTWEVFLNIFDKLTLMQHILKSLCFLGHKELADYLIKRYKLEAEYRDLLDNMRQESLSRIPEYCQYKRIYSICVPPIIFLLAFAM